MVAGQEHVVQRGEAGQQQADGEAEDHQPRDLGPVLLLRDSDDGLVGRHHPLRARGALDHHAEGIQ